MTLEEIGKLDQAVDVDILFPAFHLADIITVHIDELGKFFLTKSHGGARGANGAAAGLTIYVGSRPKV